MNILSGCREQARMMNSLSGCGEVADQQVEDKMVPG